MILIDISDDSYGKVLGYYDPFSHEKSITSEDIDYFLECAIETLLEENVFALIRL